MQEIIDDLIIVLFFVKPLEDNLEPWIFQLYRLSYSHAYHLKSERTKHDHENKKQEIGQT